MKIAYAIVTHIDSHEATVGGFLRGVHVSRHRAQITCVYFSGGYKFYTLSQKDPDGSVMVQGMRLEVGDSFELMTLPGGLVVNISPQHGVQPPALELARLACKN